MSKLSTQCPQCHHNNSVESLKCNLCDWQLIQENLDETLAITSDPDRTIAPHEISEKVSDSDLTQAPLSTVESKLNNTHSIAERQTFHLAGDLAHFEVREILGQGGMGAVYHARDITLQRDVAIKMLRPLQIGNQLNNDTLLDEARMASKLNHPNIVTIYDVARRKDSNYIVMEWVDGQPLDELIPDKGLELEKALKYACQIADGLTNAHDKYIIHRDIKPQNIMLSEQNNIKILDFGIAGYINNFNEKNSESSGFEQSITGTPSYMSPEQAQGLNLDQRTDIFSFGIVLYQMLTGKRPFVAVNLTELKKIICAGTYLPIQKHLPNLPSHVVNLLEKMLKTKKDERWQSSRELSCELYEIYEELTYKKNWWQRRNWLSKAAMVLPFFLVIAWSSKEILFPASTQQLIERQLQEANKIAILPFENISGDPEIQLFGDGLAVNLGSDLAAIASHQGNTWIVPSTEISRMKNQTIKAVSDKYGVNMILTGSIQHLGSTRLMVLNLIDALTGQQVKTTEVNINAENLFQGYGQIRNHALQLLNWDTPLELNNKFESQRPQLDGAYKEYVKGVGYLYRYDQAGNLDKALTSFSKAITLDEEYDNAYVGLAEVHLINFIKTDDTTWLNEMGKIINKLENISAINYQIKYLQAEVAMQRGKYTDAIKLYQESINQYPKYIKSQIGLANAYTKNAEIKKAESTYQSNIKSFPNNLRLISDFGVFYTQNGDYENALTQFKQLSKMSPNNDISFRNMAGIYYYLGDIENAILYTKQAIKIKPSYKAYSNLGTMLFYVKKYNESINAYKKAINLNDSNYTSWGNLGDAYKLTNNNEKITCYNNAVDRVKKSLKTNPNNTKAIAHLAYYLASLNKKAESIEYAKQINDTHTGYENFFVATAYDELKMIDETIRHLQTAIDKNYPLKEVLETPLLKQSRKTKRFKKLTKEK